MTEYAVFLFVVAAIFCALAVSVYRGNNNLIHSYHQENVRPEEMQAYCRAFSKGLFAVVAGLVLSGGVALLGETTPIALASVGVLFAGLGVAFAILIRVQKRFNRTVS